MHDLRIVEGSETHRDVLYLMHRFKAASECEAVETAVRLQAQLARTLECHGEAWLWGGAPFDQLHIYRDGANPKESA